MDGGLRGESVKHRGRPRKVDGRTRTIVVRVTEKEYRDILSFAGRYGDTYSDVMRNAFRFFTNFMRVNDE